MQTPARGYLPGSADQVGAPLRHPPGPARVLKSRVYAVSGRGHGGRTWTQRIALRVLLLGRRVRESWSQYFGAQDCASGSLERP